MFVAQSGFRDFLRDNPEIVVVVAFLFSVGLGWIGTRPWEGKRVTPGQGLGLLAYFVFVSWLSATLLTGRFMPTPSEPWERNAPAGPAMDER